MDSGLRRNDGGSEAGFQFRQVHSVVWASIAGRSGRPGRDVVVSRRGLWFPVGWAKLACPSFFSLMVTSPSLLSILGSFAQ